MSYTYDGLLSLDARSQRLLFYIDHQVSRLEVSGDVEGEIQLADGLGPFVRQRSLFLGLFLARGGVFSGGWICREPQLC